MERLEASGSALASPNAAETASVGDSSDGGLSTDYRVRLALELAQY